MSKENKEDVTKNFLENYMTALWYLGFENDIKELLLYLKRKHVPRPTFPDRIITDQWGDNFPVRVLWNTLVLMFGNYGTSPSGGWIDDVDGAINFLEETKKDWSSDETFRF